MAEPIHVPPEKPALSEAELDVQIQYARNAAGAGILYSGTLLTLLIELKNRRQDAAGRPDPGPRRSGRSRFPGTASMHASERRMAVSTDWLRGWNACLDEIDQLGGFNDE